MDIEDLFRETTDEEEKSFQMVIPEFNACGGEEGTTLNSTNGKQDKKECCSEKSLTSSSLTECCKTNKYEEEEKITVKKSDQTKFMCYKCKVNKASFANKQDKVCKTCLLEVIVHRFKSSLRKNLKIWKDDLNLICISGGSNSMALLHMMFESLFGHYSQRKMFFKVHILYIEEGSTVYEWSEEVRQRNVDTIIRICQSYNFTYTIIPLEAVYDIPCQIDLKKVSQEETKKIEEEKLLDEEQHSVPVNLDQYTNKIMEVENLLEKRANLQQLIKSLPTISSFREDLIFYLKRWIIVDFALKTNFKKILLGTNAQKVSTQLLSQLAKGRGLSIAYEISYADDKNFGGRISFMNPMREFLQKELALYNYLNKVEIIAQKSLAQINNPTTQIPAFASTDQLIEKFFTKLQGSFNVNTVPTVVRLTDKLLKTETQGEYPFCPLCFGIRDKVNNLLEIGSTIKRIIPKEDGSNEVQTIKSSDEWLNSKLEHTFCFGCKRMAISALDKENFIKLIPEVVKVNCERTLLSIEEEEKLIIS